MTRSSIEAQRLLQARMDAFTALKRFLQDHGPIDSVAKQAELDRLRRRAEIAVQAFEESAA